MEEISKELQELVDTNKLNLEEAQLIHKIREGELDNPIKEEKEVAETIDIKEIETAINNANKVIETSGNVIQKFEKAITMLNDPNSTLFNYEEFLSEDDRKQLSVLNQDLKEKLVRGVEKLKETVEGLTTLKENTLLYSDNVKHLFSQSNEVNEAKVNQYLKEEEEKKVKQSGDNLNPS